MVWGLLVFVFAIGGVLADDCCSAEDRREVARIWEDIWSAEFSGRRVTVAQAVFADLFEGHPDAVALFDGVNGGEPDSPEFKAHCVRVVNGLDTTINLLGSPATLDYQLAHLNAQHVKRDGVKKEHFKAIGESFLHVLPQVSSCFNPDAFRRCFKRIAVGIAEDLP